MVVESPDQYLQSAPDPAQPWLREFWAYVEAKPALKQLIDDVLRRRGFLAATPTADPRPRPDQGRPT